jgi:exonuclease VII small subunit
MSIKMVLDELEEKIEKKPLSKNANKLKKSDNLIKKTKKKIIESEEAVDNFEQHVAAIQHGCSLDQPLIVGDEIQTKSVFFPTETVHNEANFMEQMKRITELKELIETNLDILNFDEILEMYAELTTLINACREYLNTNKLKIQYL